MQGEYTLLVVDDEKKAREHVLRDIAWSKLSITSLYEAADGGEALGVIALHHPDIMIVDVRMPGMDGIALVEEVHARGLNMQIIALSGYSDFEAARRMLASGRVVEYLLKPASEDAMFEAVYKCIANIDEQKRIAELRDNLNRAEAAARRAALLASLFGGEQEEGSEAFLHPRRAVQVAVLSCGDSAALKAACRQWAASPLEYCFRTEHPQRKALFFAADTLQELAPVADICESVSAACGGWAGIGRVYTGEQSLGISFQEALLALVSRAFLPERRILCIEDAEGWLTASAGDVSAADIARMLAEGDLAAMKQATAALLKSLLHSRKDRLLHDSRGHVDPAGIAIYFANLVDAAVPDRKEELNLSAILEARDFDELLHVVNGTFARLHHSRRSDGGGHKAAIVRDVKAYIQAHYAEHITLAGAAQVAYINATYLSKLFAEVEGTGFSDYIAGVRIQRAKELLGNRRLKIYEIADQVGYHNVKHFMRVFKRLEGVTPSEYKEKNYFL